MLSVPKYFGLVRWFGLGVVLALCVVLASGTAKTQETDEYINPVSKGFADTFADPAVIKAKDGYWYAYGTTDPLKEGEDVFHTIPIARSKNLVDWTYVRDAFDEPSDVSWADNDAALWAPDIRYMNGKYYMYYVVTQTETEEYPNRPNDNAIGVATAPTPTGPWTDSGAPVVGPRAGESGEPGDFKWTFDPGEFTDEDGTRYLYYGSYYGGIFVTELSPDGTEAIGDPEMVAIDNRYEGPYVIKRNGYYYLFASSANCCAGPTTGYSVYVGRSKSPRGPFLDREGQSMMDSRVGGTIVVTPNGNKWVGTGHNAIVTDLSGEDWFVYHAIDRNDPYLDEPFGINERPMLLDRLDWIDGWPTVRGGSWASEDSQPAPVTSFAVGDDFNGDTTLGTEWRREGADQDGWQLASEQDAGGYVRQSASSSRPSYLVSAGQAPDDFRAEADLRLPAGSTGAAGLVAVYRDPGNHIVAWLDARAKALVTDVLVNGRRTAQKTSLPTGFRFDTWHNVAVEVRGSTMTAEVTDARLGDPLVAQQRTLPTGAGGQGAVGVASRSAQSEADNVGATALHTSVVQTAPDPAVGALAGAYSDEFNDRRLGQSWSWVRRPAGKEANGVYSWPTQEGDLLGTGNNASVLLRDPPVGDYTVETKLTIDLGVETVRNYQQGGLIAYVDDDHWTRLSHVAIWNTRQTEFGKEMPFADGLSFGGMLIGPPADTTWLRLSHRVDPDNREHEFRAATSRDGDHWIWGGVWTLPAGTNPQIGLISLGRAPDDPVATSEFDYFRVYRP
jgi:arabinan endo-1,5-alpha-L-arabinosidase